MRMKSLSKKVSSLLFALVILFTTVVFGPQTGTVAQAASTYYISNSSKNMVFYSAPDDLPAKYTTIKVYNQKTYKKPKASSIKSLKSSNPSVAKPYIDTTGEIRVYFFKKPGKATISFKIGGQTLKTTLTVKKYSNPVSTFKIGKKDFTSRFNSTTECNYFHTAAMNNQKVTIKAAKGWKITSIYIKYGSSSYRNGSCSKTSFSKKLSFNGAEDYISVSMYNAKSKAYVNLTWNGIKE